MNWLLRIFAIGALMCACSSRGPEGTVSGDCSDGEDNDADRQIDCADDGCAGFISCQRATRPKSRLLSAQVKAAAEKEKKADDKDKE